MGISGLYNLLKSIQNPCHIQSFAGKTVAIDGYAWLHRAATSCATQLALGQPTNIYVRSIMNRVRMLSHFGVTPYFVFDGDYLPSKAGTEKGRSQQRENARRLGSELLALGKTQQAHQALNAAIDITPEMAAAVICELKRQQIAYIVAPYEADAQLAYLEHQGHVDAVLAEDSDLLVFGVKCLITKLDQHGNCVVFERKKFAACRGASLAGWTDKDFRHMAILSGCDYLPNLKSIGLTRAHSLLRRHRTIERVLQVLRLEGKVSVPQDYLTKFIQADQTFLYQLVFCPKKQELVHLNTLDSNMKLEDLPFLGTLSKPEIAAAVSRAELHPNTQQPLIPYPSYQSTNRYGLQHTHIPQPVKTKAIDSFFKTRQSENMNPDILKKPPPKPMIPGRIPLAELDVNSFILTSKQLEAQRQTTASLPQTPNANIANENAPTVQSSVRSSHNRSSVKSAKRLCFDDPSNVMPSGSVTSKFFSTPGQKKRKTSPAFSIHSDGSDADAFWALVDQTSGLVSQSSKPSHMNVIEESITIDLDATLVEELNEADGDDTLVEIAAPQASDKPKTTLFQEFSLKLESQKHTSTLLTRKRKASQSTPISPVCDQLSSVEKDGIPESDLELVEALTVVPASDAIEAPSPASKPLTSTLQCGSEDLLVSESDYGDTESPIKKQVDFSRFAYERVST